jgi:hypothetical protein
VPVVLARLEEHRVAGPDDLDLSTPAIAETYALGDVDGLPVRVGVPRGSGTGGEVDACGPEAGRFRGRGDGVDEDGAGKRLARPGRGLGAAVPGDLHAVLLVVGKMAAVLSGGVSAPEAAMLCVRRSSFRATVLDGEHAAAATPRGLSGRTSPA